MLINIYIHYLFLYGVGSREDRKTRFLLCEKKNKKQKREREEEEEEVYRWRDGVCAKSKNGVILCRSINGVVYRVLPSSQGLQHRSPLHYSTGPSFPFFLLTSHPPLNIIHTTFPFDSLIYPLTTTT